MYKLYGNISYQRPFYQILMSLAFTINTGHRYNFLLSRFLYLSIFNVVIMIILAPSYIIWMENNLSIHMLLELILYIILGVLNSTFFTILVIKKQAITSNYNFIQTDFIQCSIERGMDPNKIYNKVVKIIKILCVPTLIATGAFNLGPFMTAMNDLGELPLDDRSHWLMFWPDFFSVDKLSTYGILYSLQSLSSTILMISLVSFNFGFIIFVSELNSQFRHLFDQLQDTFDCWIENKFENKFIICIRQHQLIIQFIDDFKSYYKWIILIDIIILQGVFAIIIYILIKVNAPFGYKMKITSIVMFALSIFCFHCHVGESALSMHKRLSNHIYNMPWYDMPNIHKKLVVIMFQRTQKDFTFNSALFPSEMASRSLMSKVIKQVYTLLNLLLKT